MYVTPPLLLLPVLYLTHSFKLSLREHTPVTLAVNARFACAHRPFETGYILSSGAWSSTRCTAHSVGVFQEVALRLCAVVTSQLHAQGHHTAAAASY